VVDCGDGCQKEVQEEAEEAGEESYSQPDNLQQKSGKEKICPEAQNSQKEVAEKEAGPAARLE